MTDQNFTPIILSPNAGKFRSDSIAVSTQISQEERSALLGREKKQLFGITHILPQDEEASVDFTSTRIWDVKMPRERKQSIAGKMIPSLSSSLSFGARRRNRRISLQIQRPNPSPQQSHWSLDDAENTPDNFSSRSALLLGLLEGKDGSKNSTCYFDDKLLDDEVIVFKISRPITEREKLMMVPHDQSNQTYDSDDEFCNTEDDRLMNDSENYSVSTLGISGADEEPDTREWVDQYLYFINEVKLTLCAKNLTEIELMQGKKKTYRQLYFESSTEAHSFFKLVMYLQRLERERAQRIKPQQTKICRLNPLESVNILIEICSARGLNYSDDTQMIDPYVVIQQGNKNLHITKHISNTCNPTWTVKTGSLFVMSIQSNDLMKHDHIKELRFRVMNKSGLSSQNCLGTVCISQATILSSNGERLIYHLTKPNKSQVNSCGMLALKFRRATSTEMEFMTALKNGEDLLQCLTQKVFKLPEHASPTLSPKCSLPKNPKLIKDEKYTILVLPRLTDSTIKYETLQPSKSWIEAGSGNLGQMYIEILYCDNLLIADKQEIPKPNTFASIVYGNGFVNTDVIPDCESPHWLPSSKRAFVLRTSHPSSNANIGVMNWSDKGIHQPIGRVTVNTSCLEVGTEYLLKYKLHPSKSSKKDYNYEINIRVRIETDIRKNLWASLRIPSKTLVCVDGEKNLDVLTYTVKDEFDSNKRGLASLESYMDELASYKTVILNFEKKITSIILWRSTYCISKPFKISLPIHSIVTFVLGIYLVEQPHYIPSFIAGFFSWVMLRNNASGRSKENVSFENHAQTYIQLCCTLLFGNSHPYDKCDENRNLNDEKYQHSGGGDIFNDFNLDPDNYGSHISQVETQQTLANLCYSLRIIKSILSWQEKYYSFWLTTCLIFMTIGFALIPWGWIFLWFCRIFVWMIFGPWMMLYEKLFSSQKCKNFSESEHLSSDMGCYYESKEQIEKEDELKSKDMKELIFGSTIKKIPLWNIERHMDVPLNISSNRYVSSSQRDKMTSLQKQKSIDFELLEKRMRVNMIPHFIDDIDDDNTSNYSSGLFSSEYSMKEEITEVTPLLPDTLSLHGVHDTMPQV